MPYKEYEQNYVQNVIWGAFEYAEELGFAPPKYCDFDITQYILDPIDEVDFVEIEFGQDGKPLFIAGPHDNVQKIRNILTKKLGVEGYHFLHPMGNTMDFDDFEDDFDGFEVDFDDFEGNFGDFEDDDTIEIRGFGLYGNGTDDGEILYKSNNQNDSNGYDIYEEIK
jgi:hypothetical protein